MTGRRPRQGLPRLLLDIEAVQQNAQLLRERMELMRAELAQVERVSGRPLRRLGRLDAARTRMGETLEMLHELDRWQHLQSDAATAIVRLEDAAQAAPLLLAMRRSCSALAQLRGHECARAAGTAGCGAPCRLTSVRARIGSGHAFLPTPRIGSRQS